MLSLCLTNPENPTWYTFNDTAGTFARPPFIAHFKVIRGNFDFVLITIHTAPDYATTEITAIPAVIADATGHFQERDAIVLGDYNSDCGYFDEDSYKTIFSPSEYGWLIPNSADTNIAASDCTYDRIVVTSSMTEDYAGAYGVYRFDDDMTAEAAKDVSDHRPVWAEFSVGRDSDWTIKQPFIKLWEVLSIATNVIENKNGLYPVTRTI